MGLLRDLDDPTRTLALDATFHFVGRSRRCDLHLEHAEVSGAHALIAWEPGGWQVTDLHSSNGTYVGKGRLEFRLDPGAPHVLEAGDVVAFGAERPAWVLASAARPGARATSEDDGATVREGSEGAGLKLPGGATVWLDEDFSTWNLSQPDVGDRVLDGDEVTVAGRRWKLELPKPLERTRVRPETRFPVLVDVALERDGDGDVHLRVRRGGVEHDLGAHKPHELLWVLAERPGEWFSSQEITARFGAGHGGRVHMYTFRLRLKLQEELGLGLGEPEQLLERSLTHGIRLNLPASYVRRRGGS